MTVVRGTELGRALAQSMAQINAQIEVVRDEAKSMGIDPYKMRDGDGGWVMIPLVVAKVQCLHALVLVNQRSN